MPELSAQKKMNVVQLYLEGKSHDEIAAQAGVAKGSVSNMIGELKAGKIIELDDPIEQVNLLRDLAVELKRQDADVASAVMGLSCMQQVLTLGVEPSELAGFVSMCRGQADMLEDISADEFIKAALEIHRLSKESGLDPRGAQARVQELTESLGALEARVKDQEAAEERVNFLRDKARALEERRTALQTDVSALERRLDSLGGEVSQRERRENALSGRVSQLEQRAHSADERLVATRRALKDLAANGLDEADLEGFLGRVVAVAQRHQIPPEDVRHRLVTELENLDVGLGLDTVTAEKEVKIKLLETEIGDLETQRQTLNGRVKGLKKEEKRLEGGLEVLQGRARGQIIRVGNQATAAVIEETKGLQNVLNSFQSDVLKLAGKAARLDSDLNSNRWMKKFLALFDEKGDLDPSDARTVVLVYLTAFQTWLDRHTEVYLPSAKLTLGSLINTVRGWRT